MITTICLWIILCGFIAFIYSALWAVEWRNEMQDKLDYKHIENEGLRRLLREIEKGESK